MPILGIFGVLVYFGCKVGHKLDPRALFGRGDFQASLDALDALQRDLLPVA